MNFTQTSWGEATGRAVPAGACDCHAHIYGPFDQFPRSCTRLLADNPARLYGFSLPVGEVPYREPFQPACK